MDARCLKLLWYEDLRDDMELTSSRVETPLSDFGAACRRWDLFLRVNIDCDFVECDPELTNGPELIELEARIVTDPITTAPAVFGLN